MEIPVWAFVGSADAGIMVLDRADHCTVPALVYLDKERKLISWLTGQYWKQQTGISKCWKSRYFG